MITIRRAARRRTSAGTTPVRHRKRVAAFLTLSGIVGATALAEFADPAAAAVGYDPADAILVVQAPEKARTVASFENSVGVNVHWEYNDTPYGWDYTRVRKALVDSGIKHVRGSSIRAADLVRDGIKTDAVVDMNYVDGTHTPATRWETLAPLVRSGAVDAVEGPNEPDIYWVTKNRSYKGLKFPEGVIAWQRDLWNLAKSDPTTKNVTVIGPSHGRNYWINPNPFPDGSLTPYVDLGSFHPYQGPNSGNNPTSYAGLPKYYWNSDFPSISLDRYPHSFRAYAGPFAPKPMAATETGYSNWKYAQNEHSVAKYMPRVFLENWRLGIPRTYTYEFLDTFVDPTKGNRDAHYGLLRNDVTPKPAYTAVQSMMSAVRDVTPAAGYVRESDTLDYLMTVTPPKGYDARYLHRVLLQRSDGTFVLALWHEVTANNADGMGLRPITEIAQPAMKVDLALPTGSRVTGRVLDDAGRAVPASLATSGSTVSLSVPDRVTFLEIDVPSPAPAAVTAPPVSLTSLVPTASTNGYAGGPVERNRSVGSGTAGDGTTLRLGGTAFAAGYGTQATSALTFDIAGRYSSFRSTIGVDDAVGDKGSVVFEAYADGALKYRSPILTGSSAPLAIDVPVSGARTLKLVATDAGDGMAYDHADWAGPVLVRSAAQPAPAPAPGATSVELSALNPTGVRNAWGPPERNRSNGEKAAGDGRTLSIAGKTYATGIGAHAGFAATYALGGRYTTFSAVIGIDDEVGARGSVTFDVFVDGVKRYRSPLLTGTSAGVPVSVDVRGATSLRLEAHAEDSGLYDHADWAQARLTSG